MSKSHLIKVLTQKKKKQNQKNYSKNWARLKWIKMQTKFSKKNKSKKTILQKQVKNQAKNSIKFILKLRNNNFIYPFIIQLISLFDINLDKKAEVSTFLVFCNNQDHKPENSTFWAKINLLQNLAIFI